MMATVIKVTAYTSNRRMLINLDTVKSMIETSCEGVEATNMVFTDGTSISIYENLVEISQLIYDEKQETARLYK